MHGTGPQLWILCSSDRKFWKTTILKETHVQLLGRGDLSESPGKTIFFLGPTARIHVKGRDGLHWVQSGSYNLPLEAIQRSSPRQTSSLNSDFLCVLVGIRASVCQSWESIVAQIPCSILFHLVPSCSKTPRASCLVSPALCFSWTPVQCHARHRVVESSPTGNVMCMPLQLVGCLCGPAIARW